MGAVGTTRTYGGETPISTPRSLSPTLSDHWLPPEVAPALRCPWRRSVLFWLALTCHWPETGLGCKVWAPSASQCPWQAPALPDWGRRDLDRASSIPGDPAVLQDMSLVPWGHVGHTGWVPRPPILGGHPFRPRVLLGCNVPTSSAGPAPLPKRVSSTQKHSHAEDTPTLEALTFRGTQLAPRSKAWPSLGTPHPAPT